jgi:hypothetical protein
MVPAHASGKLYDMSGSERDQFIQTFSEFEQQVAPFLNQAATLSLHQLAQGKEISHAECLAIEQSITASSEINPVRFHSESGNEQANICDVIGESLHYYLLEAPGVVNLGRHYTRVLQVQGIGYDNTFRTMDGSFATPPIKSPISNRYFISENNQIVEMDKIRGIFEPDKRYTRQIAVLNTNGDYYMTFLNNRSPLTFQSKGITQIEHFNYGDGSGRASQYRVIEDAQSNNPAEVYNLRSFDSFEHGPWKSQTVITFDTQFFEENGKYYSYPNYPKSYRHFIQANTLLAKSDGQPHVCRFGYSASPSETHQFGLQDDNPVDYMGFTKCIDTTRAAFD